MAGVSARVEVRLSQRRKSGFDLVHALHRRVRVADAVEDVDGDVERGQHFAVGRERLMTGEPGAGEAHGVVFRQPRIVAARDGGKQRLVARGEHRREVRRGEGAVAVHVHIFKGGAAQRREEAIQAAAEAKEGIEYGDCIGTVRVEGTEVDCELYWGDTNAIFRAGAGCSADNGCVMPGENGTVFVGAHTDTYFNKLFDAEEGALIHLDTIYGDFVYEITGFEVIGETEVDKCRWGAEEPSCILYTCYPQGIQVPTPYRYLAYADPVETDENGVVPQSLPGLSDAEADEAAQTQPNAEEAEAPAGESED